MTKEESATTAIEARLVADPPAADPPVARSEAHFYPVFLDLRGRRCVVVGGGDLADVKARELIAAGASVTVVAAQPSPGIEALARGGQLRLRRRSYREGDLAGAFLAVAALADGPEALEGEDERDAVWREASRRGLPLNSVDDPPRCSFIAGSVARWGDLTIAISTSGKAPALAVRLRQWLERQLGAEHARFLALAGSVRAPLAARHPDLALRRELWYRLVDSDALELLRHGNETAARQRFAEILGVDPAAATAPEHPALGATQAPCAGGHSPKTAARDSLEIIAADLSRVPRGAA